MTAAGSGAVFFLGTRAHYQVLQQPDTQSNNMENGNTSTESIYQHSSTTEIWTDDKTDEQCNYAYSNDVNDNCDADNNSSTYLNNHTTCRENEFRDNDMRPAQLNNINNSTPKSPPRRSPLVAIITSLRRKKRRLGTEAPLPTLEALYECTYKESCRCFDCQSRYFECDDDSELSDDSEAAATLRKYMSAPSQMRAPPAYASDDDEEENDEVFIDKAPSDNTSTDLLLSRPEKMSVGSSISEGTLDPDDQYPLEVAAGTPLLLNYLLTHPLTCSLQ